MYCNDNQFDDEYDEGFIDSPIEERSDVNWLKSIINSSMNDDMKVGILSNYNEILGKTARFDLDKGTPLSWDIIE